MNVLELIESIARERGIEKDLVISVMEEILLNFAVEKFGDFENMFSKIHEDGSFEVYLNKEVVHDDDYDDSDNFYCISHAKALKRNAAIVIGDVVKENLPFVVGKSDVDNIFSSFKKKLNEIQKEKEYQNFHDKVGLNFVGYVKKMDMADAIISFNEIGEGVLKKAEMLPGDSIRPGSYVKVNIKEVKQGFGRQVFLSRTNEAFLKELLKQEVPEIQDGLVEIKSVARDAGSLSKIAVFSSRSSINPVSVCIGLYGGRIQAVSKELLGEKLNVVEWNADIYKFITNAMAPASIVKVEEVGDLRYNVVTNAENFSKAMGRGGQNVFLAKKLCSVVSIKLLTEEEEYKIYQEYLTKATTSLIHALEIEEMMARLLISEGFDSIEKIGKSDTESLCKLNGFDEELAGILLERAVDYMSTEKKNIEQKLIQNGSDLSILDVDLTSAQIAALMDNNVFSRQDIAILDAQELEEIFTKKNIFLSFEDICKIITKARNIKEKIN